jgi:cysteine desulfurase
MDTIYLDHNATTPIHPDVVQAMDQCYRDGYANPASLHHEGRRARRALEDARQRIAALLKADITSLRADQLIFTSGGTESNNLAILGLAGSSPGKIVRSAIEHPSVIGPTDRLMQEGRSVCRLRVTPDGVADLNHLKELLTEPTRLVSLMLANNETGVLQPVQEAVQLCRERGALVHTDAVQVVGKLPVDFRQLGVAAMTVSAHKFHGPRGIGALLLRHGVQIEPLLYGGFQQMGIRCGTECVALAVGFCKALELWREEADERAARMAQLRVRLESTLREALPWAIVNGEHAPRLPHTTSLSLPGIDRQALLMALDTAGLCCSTGSACASGSTEPSHVLLAMSCQKPVVDGALRLSLGATTTAAEIAQACQRIIATVKRLRSPSTTA